MHHKNQAAASSCVALVTLTADRLDVRIGGRKNVFPARPLRFLPSGTKEGVDLKRERDGVDGIAEQYRDRKIDRREFFKRAGALGVSMSAASALLASPAYAREQKGATARVTRGGTFIEGYDRDFTKMDTVQSGWADPG